MKQILFFFIFCFCSLKFSAQDLYNFELNNLHYVVKKGVKNTTKHSNVTIKILLENGEEKIIYRRPIRSRGDKEEGWRHPSFSVFSRPISIQVSGFVNFRTGTDARFNETLVIKPCGDQHFDIDSHSPRMSSVRFSIKSIPPSHTFF
ncbi:hypothetical protein QIU18_02825 [Capnocytophaga canimorsus]|nr:hypothetical protein [Capnocytophaga canimorsus]WGU67925.1 hypothetical protein QIU19_11010 [Capnocytophaga canimorsus]WGU70975.1 hypothetical protein QIU18_02825 [Capnocytophaga canimorsus]